MSIPTLEGVTARTITTPCLTTRVLFSGPEGGTPVIFLHGNLSSATWWEEVMVTLPEGFWAIAPDQRGFGEADPEEKIDATRGMGDLADDVVALLAQLNVEKAHFVGNSLGGSVIWHLLIHHPERFLTVTLVAPGSPYGFGGIKGIEGTPCYDDYAGSGGGLGNPELIKRLKEGDRSTDSMFSPRSAFRMLVVKPPFIPKREEALLSAMLAMHLGDKDYPGDSVQSTNWPFVGPGKWGAANALSPKYANDISKLYDSVPKPPILWIRGSHDVAVSNNAVSDPATAGAAGLLPNWPGNAVFPPQPMIEQTRAVLTKYADAGGSFQEVIIENTGHVPYIEKLAEFNRVFHQQLLGE